MVVESQRAVRRGRPHKKNCSRPRAGLLAVLRAQPREWLFCCAFWLCQTIPVTVILFYSPIILSDVTGSADQTGRVALIYTLFMIGILPMTLLKRTINPAMVLVVTAVVMAASLAGVESPRPCS